LTQGGHFGGGMGKIKSKFLQAEQI
jgi:hypothetical protein